MCDIPNTSVDEDALKALRENDPRETRREFAIKMDVHRSTIIRRLSSIGKVNNLNERASYNLKDQNEFYRYRFTMIIVNNIRRLNKVPYTYFKTIHLFMKHIVGMRLGQKMTSGSKFFRTLNCSSYSLHFFYIFLFLFSFPRINNYKNYFFVLKERYMLQFFAINQS